MAVPIAVLETSAPVRPAVAARAFRPFFLAAAAFAALSVLAWLVAWLQRAEIADYMALRTWHAREMVFGYTLAVMAGFLLTAVVHWTSRPAFAGRPLLALLGLWAVGRVAVALAFALPPALVAAVDLAFLPAVAVAFGRPVLAARSRRNYGILALLALLWAAQATTHLDALGLLPGWGLQGTRVGIDLVLVVVAVITGRIVPLFTRNATGVETIRGRPPLERATVAALVALALADAFAPGSRPVPWIAAAAGLLAAARMAGWGTRHTLREPLLWVLHAGAAFLPVGLLLRAWAEGRGGLDPVLGLHALTVGTIGLLTLGMMARVALGHTGRPLKASGPTALAFRLLLLAAVARVAVPPLGPAWEQPAIAAAALLWSAAFALYLVAFAPILLRPRADGRPG